MVEKWLTVKEEMLRQISDENDFVRAVFSGRRRNFQPEFERIDIRIVRIKEDTYWQTVSTKENDVNTKNYSLSDFKRLALVDSGFANFVVESRTERLEVRIGKRGQVFRRSTRINAEPSYDHDHKKKRVLQENDPFLIAVGISDGSGKIKPSMRDKYLQVEEFLRILEKSLDGLKSSSQRMRVVDLGCGHAYLTFAAFRYFQLQGTDVSLVGVDVKPETRIRNEKIAAVLGISNSVKFLDSTIAEFPPQEVDLAIALHACDTATDDALAWAVTAGAKVILAAPCCHHDLHSQMRATPEPVKEIFEHGILKVRQVDLLTDAIRATILELVGYKAEVFEFISGDHTARNLIIRAIRKNSWTPGSESELRKVDEYRKACSVWAIQPALATRLKLGELLSTD